MTVKEIIDKRIIKKESERVNKILFIKYFVLSKVISLNS